MSWTSISGAAIATRPFVASEEHQVSLLTGDHLEIFHQCDQWYHGRNMLTQIEGIFPACCVAFYEMKVIDKRVLLAKPEDLLIVEARYTLKYALTQIHKGDNPRLICAVTKRMEEVVTLLRAFSSSSSKEVIVNIHHDLATALDHLRTVLKLKPPSRTETGSESTLTTWGKEMFTRAPIVRINRREPQYSALHCSIDAGSLKMKLECRFAIFALKKQSWITEPVSKMLSPDNPKCDIVFTDLDRKVLNDRLYLVSYNYEGDDRSLDSISVCDLPSCKTESSLRRPTMKFEMRSYECDSVMFEYGMHEKLIIRDARVMKVVKETSPVFTIQFTPFYGTKAEFTEKGYSRYQPVSPFVLPNVIPATFRKSTVMLTACSLVHNNPKKKTRILFRLIDRCRGDFLPCCEDVATGEKNAEFWRSASFKIGKGELTMIHETFAMDLLKTRTLAKDLFVAVEVQSSGGGDFSGSGSIYGIIPIASEIGALATPSNPRIPLYHLNHKKNQEPKFADFVIPTTDDLGKAAGFLSYRISFSSTTATTNPTLHRLLNFQQFPSEIGELLKTFTQCGISEWCKFFKKICLTLCLIMVLKPEHKEEAFNQLLFVCSEIVARTTADYVKQIKEFINEQFSRDKSTANHPTLMKVHEVMLPLVLQRIYIDDTSIQFRNMVKCAPYFFEIIMRSLDIRLKTEQVDLSRVLPDVTRFIDRLCAIVREVTDEKDVQRKGFVFTNQQFTIQHFAAVINAIIICIPTNQIAPLVCKFISSIRYVAEDRKQPSLEKSKMKCMLALASTSCWKDPESRAILAPTYTNVLTAASKEPYLLDFVVQILAALFLCVRNDYIVQFIPLLEENYKKEESIAMARLLLIIAYTVPTKIPPTLMTKLVGSRNLGAPERMFVFLNFVLKERQGLEKDMRDPEQPVMRKLRFLETYLDLSTIATLKIQYDELEKRIQGAIYPASNIYKTVLALFKAIPKEQRFGLQLVHSILRCYIVQSSPDLHTMFRKILMTDARANNGEPKKIILPLLKCFYPLSKEPGFIRIQSLFPPTDSKLKNFNALFSNVVQWMHDFRTMEYLAKNQDQLTDAVTKVVKVCQQTTDRDIQPKLLLKLVDFHSKCQNYVEAASAMLRVLDFIPCDYSKRPAYFEVKCETGIDLHKALLKRCIDMYAKGNYDELGLEVIERAKANVVYPYKFYNFMPELLNMEAKLYARIATTERTFSNYYFVGFYGNGFDYYYRNRCFIYRKQFNPNESFRDELALRFPDAIIDSREVSSEMMSGGGMYIRVVPVEVARPQEVEDPLYVPEDTNRLKYLIDYELHKGAKIFRYESSSDQLATTRIVQCLFFTEESFPSPSFRLEVDPRKIIARYLSPIENATMLLRRLDFEISVDTYFMDSLHENNQEMDPLRMSKFIMKVGSAVDSALNGPIAGCFNAFLKENTASLDPQAVAKFKDAVQRHIHVLETALTLNERIASSSMRDMHNLSMTNFGKLKETMSHYC